jgi:hypothetical protein
VEGIFSALNLLDDEKMNGSKQKLDDSKQRAAANQMFSNEVIGPNAFALVAHGYVLSNTCNGLGLPFDFYVFFNRTAFCEFFAFLQLTTFFYGM